VFSVLFFLFGACFGSVTDRLDAFIHAGKRLEVLSGLVAWAGFVVADVLFDFFTAGAASAVIAAGAAMMIKPKTNRRGMASQTSKRP
jgi:hypothetical protein